MKLINLALLTAVLFLSGCGSNDVQPMDAEYQVRGFAHCNIVEPDVFELVDIDQLKERQSPLKYVAYGLLEEHRVFLIAQGQKPTLGYYHQVTNFLMEGDYWQAAVINMKPEPGMVMAQVISSPCTLIAVPKTVKGFTLLDQQGAEIKRW